MIISKIGLGTNKLDNLRIALHTCKVKLINTLKLVKW